MINHHLLASYTSFRSRAAWQKAQTTSATKMITSSCWIWLSHEVRSGTIGNLRMWRYWQFTRLSGSGKYVFFSSTGWSLMSYNIKAIVLVSSEDSLIICPCVSKALSKETADWPFGRGLHPGRTGRSACCHSGGLVRTTTLRTKCPTVSSVTVERHLAGTVEGQTVAALIKWRCVCWMRIRRSCRSRVLSRWHWTPTLTTAPGHKYAWATLKGLL